MDAVKLLTNISAVVPAAFAGVAALNVVVAALEKYRLPKAISTFAIRLNPR